MTNGKMCQALQLAVLALLLAGTTAATLAAQSLELVSRVHPSQYSDTGMAARFISNYPGSAPLATSLSNDGRYLAFASSAKNLVAGQHDFNSGGDVFLRDLVTGTTTLVSRSRNSPVRTGNQTSDGVIVSGDGRFTAFLTSATDLVPGQSGDPAGHGSADLLFYDRVTDTLSIVFSHFEESASEHALSADGRYIAFTSGSDDLVPGTSSDSLLNVFLYDRVAKTYSLVNSASGARAYRFPVISTDGRYVVYQSFSHHNPSTGVTTVEAHLYDRVSGAVTLIGPGGEAAISADGRTIAVASSPGLYLYDRQTRARTEVTTSQASAPSLSADGRVVAFLTDAGLFVYDRISRTLSPGPASRNISPPVISGNGRLVAFASPDSGLAPGQNDVNKSWDIFLFDRNSSKTTLVSHAGGSASTTGNALSYHTSISADGSHVAFLSMADDLVEGLADLNQGQDVFIYETSSGQIDAASRRAPEMPSLSSASTSRARALSADGRWVVFQSRSTRILPGQEDTNQQEDVFLYDQMTRSTLLVSRALGSTTRTANSASNQAAVSADGRYVLFGSSATNLVAGSPNQGYSFFLFDRLTGATRLIARTDSTDAFEELRSDRARISPDGRWVVFTSSAPDLVPGQQEPPTPFATLDVFLWDRETGSISLVSRTTAGGAVTGNSSSVDPQISDDGRYIAFYSYATDLAPGQAPGDSFDFPDLLLHDRITAKTVLVSRIANPAAVTGPRKPFSMSADGRFIAFTFQGDYLEAWYYDRTAGVPERIAPESEIPEISGDGRYVVYFTILDRQLHLWDRVTRTTTLVTRSSSGGSSNGFAGSYTISANGRYVAFTSDAQDLIPGQVSAPERDERDSPNLDLFLFDRTADKILLVSRSKVSPVMAAAGAEGPLLLSASGEQLAFTSTEDLAPGDFNDLSDAYLFNLTGPTGGGPTPLPPCKLLDTRRRADRPALRSDTRRTVRAAGVCGVPATAKSVSVTVTALQATGKGNLRFYAGNDTVNSSGILRFEKNATRSATFNLPLATNGAGTLAILPFVAGKGIVQVVVEVNGYSL